MSTPAREELDGLLELVAREARAYLGAVDDRPLRVPGTEAAAGRLDIALPERGDGGLATIRALLEDGVEASVASGGPRFFHYVMGGSTPAAMAAAWLTDALDQNPGLWDASPLGTMAGRVSLEWLRDLFGLPEGWGGTLVTGGTMANYAGLAAARRWWGQQHGVDVEDRGLAELPPVPVFSSGYVHSSARKALAMLGIGRGRLLTFSADDSGRLDLDALSQALGEAARPAIVIANAGEVNAGDFDPIADVATLADEHGAWLHVDGAFGLFAALSPRTKHLLDGIERADSVAADAHKWLNVPHDTGFTFVRDPALLEGAFAQTATYLTTDPARPNLMWRTPESSQRARGIAVWATLRAYGRKGYREMVEGHLDLAQRLAAAVDAAPDFERLAEVPLNIVCFRYRPSGLHDEAALDAINTRIGEEILSDGRVYVGTTVFEGKVAFRPAIVNWRTRDEDVDLIVETIREVGARLAS